MSEERREEEVGPWARGWTRSATAEKGLRSPSRFRASFEGEFGHFRVGTVAGAVSREAGIQGKADSA